MDKWIDKLSEHTICFLVKADLQRKGVSRESATVYAWVHVYVCVCVHVHGTDIAVRVEINAVNIVAITTAACK